MPTSWSLPILLTFMVHAAERFERRRESLCVPAGYTYCEGDTVRKKCCEGYGEV